MSQKFVLVVEDDRNLGQAYVEIVTLEGHRAELAINGRDALTRLQQIQPDLILLDMHLPHTSGLDILKYIISEPRHQHTRVIVMTADPKMAEAAQPDAHSVYFKPVNLAQITEILALI